MLTKIMLILVLVHIPSGNYQEYVIYPKTMEECQKMVEVAKGNLPLDKDMGYIASCSKVVPTSQTKT